MPQQSATAVTATPTPVKAVPVAKSPPKAPKPIKPGQIAASMTQLAEMLGVHPRTLKRDAERSSGFPRPLVVGKSKHLFMVTDVIEYYQKRSATP